MNDIVIIAPFEELYLLCNKIIKENSYKDIDVIFGDLSQGVVEAKKAVVQGAKIIISRGGTYSMIKKSVDVPVVEIRMTSFDLLRGFKNIINYKGKIGVVGYSNVIYGSDTIGELLDLDIIKIEIDREENAEEIIKPYIDKGIKVFIGDTIGNRISSKLNCKSYVIKSSKDSIISAIKDARRALRLSKVEQERTEHFKAITDFVHDGIISIDENEKITLINNTAKIMFNLEDDVIGEPIQRILPTTRLDIVLNTGVPELGELQDVGDFIITTNRVPIIVDGKIKGVVATFNDVTELQKLEKNVRMKLSKKGFLAKYRFEDIMHSSESIKDCIIKAKRYSLYDSPVLITGKTGVGKELFAQSIHNYSNRKNGPFVAINCAALPPNLIESELFGYAEGAFTGAKRKGKPGLFELAHGGTIFLDEISEMPLELQGRLLRVLQEKEVMRVGDDKVIPIDVRTLCATNKNLTSLVNEGKFREDLFYRINVLALNIPPLNKRKEDIYTLTIYFVKKYSNKYNKKIDKIDSAVFEYLNQYNFKGNIRELEGIIERGIILSTEDKLTVSNLNLPEGNIVNENSQMIDKIFDKESFIIDEDISLEELNTKYIEHILNKYNGVVTVAAEILDISRSTIWRKTKDRNGSK